MLVGDRMTPTVITTTKERPITEALNLMQKWHIRRLPVVEEGRVIGIVTWSDLMQACPPPDAAPTSRDMPSPRDKTVAEIMTPQPKVIAPDVPLEEAATLMRDHKIGGLPVVRDGMLVGMITESDIFDALIDLLGARLPSYRMTIDVEDRADAVPEVVAVVGALGLRLYNLATYPGEAGRLRAVLRVDRALPLPSVASRLSERGLHVVHVADTSRPEMSHTLSLAREEAPGRTIRGRDHQCW